MAWSLYHTYTPSGTQGAASAGAVFQDNNVDVQGGIWNTNAGPLGAGSGAFNTSHLTRPTGENQADARIIIYASPPSGTTGSFQIVLRRADANNFYLLACNLNGASSVGQIFKYVGGSLTQLGANQTFTYVAGHVLTIDASVLSTTLAITINDVTASALMVNNYTQTDSSLSAAGQYAISTQGGTATYAITKIEYYNQSTGPTPGSDTVTLTESASIAIGASDTAAVAESAVVGPTSTDSATVAEGATVSAAVAAAEAAIVTDSGTVPGVPGSVTDPNVFFSPNGWYSNGAGAMQPNGINASSTFAVSNSPGNYIKIKPNCTGLNMTYDNTLYSAAADYPFVQWRVDGGPWNAVQLASGDAGSKSLATGLTAGSHLFEIYFVKIGANGGNDRWNGSAAPFNALKITGFTIVGGTGVTTALTLRPYRLLDFGDSITDGSKAAQGSPTNDDACSAYVPYLAEALNAEYGVIAFVGQGWGFSNVGNVPTFHTPGNTALQTWRWHSSGKSRLAGGVFAQPVDFLFVNQGTNDGINAISNATVTANAQDFMTAMATAAPAPTKGFLLLPFGRYKKTALSAVTLNANWFYIDLDVNSPADQLLATGLGNVPTGDSTAGAAASSRAADGVHPGSQAHAEIAAKLTQAVTAALRPLGRPLEVI